MLSQRTDKSGVRPTPVCCTLLCACCYSSILCHWKGMCVCGVHMCVCTLVACVVCVCVHTRQFMCCGIVRVQRVWCVYVLYGVSTHVHTYTRVHVCTVYACICTYVCVVVLCRTLALTFRIVLVQLRSCPAVCQQKLPNSHIRS